jgi:hypothetical protein
MNIHFQFSSWPWIPVVPGGDAHREVGCLNLCSVAGERAEVFGQLGVLNSVASLLTLSR